MGKWRSNVSHTLEDMYSKQLLITLNLFEKLLRKTLIVGMMILKQRLGDNKKKIHNHFKKKKVDPL